MLLQLKGIKKSFAQKEVIKGIDLSVDHKQIYGLIGASGSGKTTLMRTLMGYYEADAGEVWFRDKKVESSELRKNTGFASQESSLYPDLTIHDNLWYFGSLYGMSNEQKRYNIERVLSLVSLSKEANTPVNKLSGGMSKRADIACSILHDPDLLILDEPTTGLDPMLRKQIWHLIHKIRDQDTAIIMSSHLINDIEHLCDHVGMLSKGRFLFQSTPAHVKEHYSKREEIKLECFPGKYDELLTQIKKKVPVHRSFNKEHVLILYVDKAYPHLETILDIVKSQGEKVITLDISAPSLSEVFEFYLEYEKRH